MVGEEETFGLIPNFIVWSSFWVRALSSSILLYCYSHRPLFKLSLSAKLDVTILLTNFFFSFFVAASIDREKEAKGRLSRHTG